MSTDAGTPTPRTDINVLAAWGATTDKGLEGIPYGKLLREMANELITLRAAHEAAQAEIAALRENAERYRRVKRDHEIPWNIDVPDTIAGRFYVMYGGDPVGCLEGELDAAIDAARKAK